MVKAYEITFVTTMRAETDEEANQIALTEMRNLELSPAEVELLEIGDIVVRQNFEVSREVRVLRIQPPETEPVVEPEGVPHKTLHLVK